MQKKDKHAKQVRNEKGVIDLTPFVDKDVMQTDVLGSYTGTPKRHRGDDMEQPVQDADDL